MSHYNNISTHCDKNPTYCNNISTPIYEEEAETYKELFEELVESGRIGNYYDNESAVYRELIEYVIPELEEKIENLEDPEKIDTLSYEALESLQDEKY